ncbi:MAG: carbon-nitrogen hydrolase family protein [Oceanospirillaceae bacterium]|nr:carbon-nitrogen hydrolase family protein [Oceanospirillaceae bacterium]
MKRVALLQMVSTADLEVNLKQAILLLRQAAEQGAVLAVLPENFALLNTQRLRAFAEAELDRVVSLLCSQAAELGIWIVVGSVPMSTSAQGLSVDAPHVRAACLLIDSLGNIRARYDKLHLFDVDVADQQATYRESEFVEAGDDLVVVDTPVGALGLSICYDLRFPEQYQRLREAGAELIAVPSAFTHVTGQAHWEVLLRARAIENQVYILGCNQGGAHGEGRESWGHSMIVDPWGRLMAQCQKGSGLVVAEIDLEYLADIRQKMPVLAHRHRTGF